MTRLIVNADDFGMTPGINRATADLAATGALSSATLMANGSAYGDAVALAQRTPTLHVGCHVVLVDGTPIGLLDQMRTLIQADGHFRASLPSFVAASLAGRIRASDIEQQATAQIRKLQASGIHVHHIDTHKHTHMFPAVLRPLLRAMKNCGVHAIRNPFEPTWSIATAGHSRLRRSQVNLLRMAYARGFRRLCDEAGVVTTEGAIGVAATGSLHTKSLRALLDRLPQGVFELVCHPGVHDAELAALPTRLRASRPMETQALLQVVPEMVRAGRLVLTSFGQLPI